HYNMDYTKPIIKETIQEFRRTHPVENYTSSLEDEINGYIGQLISNVNQESSFQHFIFMKMIQQHGAILKEEKELTEFFQETERSMGDEVRKLIHTIVESIFSNLNRQAEESRQRQQEQSELEKLKQMVSDYSHQIRQLKTDYENLKSRVERQKREMREQLIEEIMQHLFPWLDQLGLSRQHSMEEHSAEMVRGIGLIHDQILATLKREFNIQRMESLLQAFDYNLHEAVSYDESDGYPEGTVLDVLSDGYYMNDRVIRHARVRVARSKS
ncbi:MAG: nucleotide exchange factor GrpE, partial [Candidatus Delongbacteria bacterium]|nr:nucleotide exchange factor GrpE [Candidatus Delongbacteria bacterium]